MNFTEQGFEIIEQQPGLIGMKKHIEIAGRTCYKSLDKITDDSCEKFVGRMVKDNHTAMLEHGTVYLSIPTSDAQSKFFIGEYSKNPYSRVNYDTPISSTAYITTNYRVVIEKGLEDTLKYMVEPTKYHEKRYTVRETANIQVYKDETRHRTFSWAIESTRFCNYLKEKFGGSVTFIKPLWLDDSTWMQRFVFKTTLRVIDWAYRYLVKSGWQQQQAANLLPQATKADVVMTAFESDWKHFFNLRALGTTGAPHPQVKEIASQIYDEFINRGYIKG